MDFQYFFLFLFVIVVNCQDYETSDAKDYDMLFAQLTETRAHIRIEGRTFGNFKLPLNIFLW